MNKKKQIQILQTVFDKYCKDMETPIHEGLCYYITSELRRQYNINISALHIKEYIPLFSLENAQHFGSVETIETEYWWARGNPNRIFFLVSIINELSRGNWFIKILRQLKVIKEPVSAGSKESYNCTIL